LTHTAKVVLPTARQCSIKDNPLPKVSIVQLL